MKLRSKVMSPSVSPRLARRRAAQCPARTTTVGDTGATPHQRATGEAAAGSRTPTLSCVVSGRPPMMALPGAASPTVVTSAVAAVASVVAVARSARCMVPPQQLTSGLNWAKVPDGLSCQTHTCRS